MAIKQTKYLVTTWWFAPLILALGLSGLLTGVILNHGVIFNYALSYLVFAYLILFAGAITQAVLKKWLVALGHLFLLVFNFCLTAFFLTFYPNDFFADDLKIPADLNLATPVTLRNVTSADSLKALTPSEPAFLLVNDFQKGLYAYYVWFEPVEPGYLYLKAFEITQNLQLSEQSLSHQTKIKINPGEVSPLVKNFTIYEGDWGKPYGARFELWFKPRRKSGEIKILERNYIIEGWMR